MKSKSKLTLVILALILAVLVCPQSAAASGGVALKVGDEISDNVVVTKNTVQDVYKRQPQGIQALQKILSAGCAHAFRIYSQN